MASEMAEKSHDNKVRKLRKKLRQIENLQRLSGYRELTDEESLKVEQRNEIRTELKELLAMSEKEKEKIENNDMQMMNSQENDREENHQQMIQEEQKLEADDISESSEKMQSNNLVEEELQEEKDDFSALKEDSNMLPNNEDSQAKERVSNRNDNEKADEQLMKKVKKNLENGRNSLKNMQFTVEMIEGHHHPICAVDSNKDKLVSGGHDTSVKIWNANTYEELFSLGGHSGSISALCLISHDVVVTGSHDCSIKIWNIKEGALTKTVYVYNPVTCLSYRDNKIAVGKESGKIDIYNRDTGTVSFSIKAHEEDVVSVEFMDDNKLASASADGVIKVFELTDTSYSQVMDSYDDVTSMSSLGKENTERDTPNTSLNALPLRKVNCMVTFKDIIFWGDDGYNVKALNIKTGHVVKLLNNLSEFSSTDSLAVLRNGDSGWLFTAGFDIDNGNGYINIRSLPDMVYIGTISDSSLGHVSCILPIWKDGKITIFTGGSELRVWQQQISMNSKKRPASDEIEDVIPCKFNCSYNNFQDSEVESDDSSSETEEDEKPTMEEPEKKSWCVLQ